MANVDQLEALLRPPELDMPPYPPKVITLASGEKMVVRQIDREEVPILLEAIYPLLWVERDYYDIVSARLFGELLAYKRYRVKNEYVLVGLIDGVLAGMVNGHLVDEKVGMSYHTMTIRRGLLNYYAVTNDREGIKPEFKSMSSFGNRFICEDPRFFLIFRFSSKNEHVG